MKGLLLFLFFYPGIHILSAQSQFGLRFGANYGTFNFADNEPGLGMHGGLTAAFPVSDKLSIYPDLMLSNIVSTMPVVPEGEVEFNILYATLPVLIGLKAGQHFVIKAGPEFSYVIDHGKAIDDLEALGVDDFPDTDLSIDAGVAYLISDQLGVEFRYSHGLMEAIRINFTDINGNSTEEFSGNKRSFQLGMFYLFK